jgi:hypothetical protein
MKSQTSTSESTKHILRTAGSMNYQKSTLKRDLLAQLKATINPNLPSGPTSQKMIAHRLAKLILNAQKRGQYRISLAVDSEKQAISLSAAVNSMMSALGLLPFTSITILGTASGADVAVTLSITSEPDII